MSRIFDICEIFKFLHTYVDEQMNMKRTEIVLNTCVIKRERERRKVTLLHGL